MELATEATTTQGNALKNQEKYEKSYTAKLQDLTNQVDEFWLSLLDSDVFKGVLDFLNELLKTLNKIPSGFTAIAAVAAIPFVNMIKASETMKNLGRAKCRPQPKPKMPRYICVLI